MKGRWHIGYRCLWRSQKGRDHYASKPRKAIKKTKELVLYYFFMEGSTSTSSRADVIKPVFLKAGIPLAISVVGFFSARIIAKRRIKPEVAASAETLVSSKGINPREEFRHEEESFQSLNSESSAYRDDEEQMATCPNFTNPVESREDEDENDHEEETPGLKTRIEELQERERELEMKFVQYCDIKEQESVLVELKSMFLLESAYTNFLDREISFMNAEYKRMESIGEKHLKVVQKLEGLKSENRLLQRKVKKLVRLTKDQTSTIKEKDSKIKSEEEEVLRNRNELETQAQVIKKLEDEMCKMQYLVDELQEQKIELLNNLNSAENSASSHSKNEADAVMEEYEQLAHEYEELQKERTAEVKEIIFLRWTNACLRHELMRHQIQQGDKQENKYHTQMEEFEASGEIGEYGIEHQLDDLVLGHGESCTGVMNGGEVCSKRRKLLQKFRRWVEGSEKLKPKLDAKEKHEIKCFGRNSVSCEVEEDQPLHGRKSCSRT